MFGFGRTAVRTWDIAKWPVLVLLVMTMLAILYWATPNVKHPGFRWISPGAILAVVIWLIASAGFAFYVANFSNYNKTYGTMGGVIIFLTWLWVGNIAVVLGAAFNAELERGRELEGGEAAEDDLTIPPRRRAKNA
jgi:membrane protein